MPVVRKPYTFIPKTPARASEVNAALDALYNAINGNLDGANLKQITINDTLSPTSDTADVYLMLSWLANRIKAFTGEVSWSAAPTKTFKQHREASELDHPDGSVSDKKIGNRTVDPSKKPTNNGPGDLTTWLSWLANRIKALSGASNWYDDPAVTLAGVKQHIDTAITSTQAVHGIRQGHGGGFDADKVDGLEPSTAANPTTIAQRDGNGDLTARVVRPTLYLQLPVLSADPPNPPDGAIWVRK